MINENKLFFIIGPGRSGTTILQELMNTYSGFCNLDESVLGKFPTAIDLWSYVRRSNDYSPLEDYINNKWTREYFVEKTPSSILCLESLLKKFPRSNYLFLERNPKNIVLSQLNLFKNEEMFEHRKSQDLKNLMITEDDLNLNSQHYTAKKVLRMVQNQVFFKNQFINSITIRYEMLKSNLSKELEKISKKFLISYDDSLSKTVFSSPSTSSKNNTYEIESITDLEAQKLINTACTLWSY